MIVHVFLHDLARLSKGHATLMKVHMSLMNSSESSVHSLAVLQMWKGWILEMGEMKAQACFRDKRSRRWESEVYAACLTLQKTASETCPNCMHHQILHCF